MFVEDYFQDSLRNLDTDYVDLVGQHSPLALGRFVDAPLNSSCYIGRKLLGTIVCAFNLPDCNGANLLVAEGEDVVDENGDLVCYDTPLFNETWARMEKLYESGKAKAIGVSNFSIKK